MHKMRKIRMQIQYFYGWTFVCKCLNFVTVNSDEL